MRLPTPRKASSDLLFLFPHPSDLYITTQSQYPPIKILFNNTIKPISHTPIIWNLNSMAIFFDFHNEKKNQQR